MSRKVESWWPLSASLFMLGVTYALYPYINVEEDSVNNALNSAITTASILAGFTGTLVSIILGTENRRSMKWIADAGDLPRLISFTFRTILANIFLVVASFVGQIFDIAGSGWSADRICKSMWVGLFAYCVTSFIRVSAILLEIMRDPN